MFVNSRPKEKVAAPVAEKAVEEPLQPRDIQKLPPFHFFTKAMFPMELSKRFEKKTSADRELTIQWTMAWLKQRGDRKGYPFHPAQVDLKYMLSNPIAFPFKLFKSETNDD